MLLDTLSFCFGVCGKTGEDMKYCKGLMVVFFSVAVITMVAGCAHSPGGVASSTTPIEGRSYTRIGPAKATDSYVLLFNFIPIKGSNSTATAIEAAKRSKGADALIEVTVDSYFQWWIILSRSVIEVRGTAIRFEDS